VSVINPSIVGIDGHGGVRPVFVDNEGFRCVYHPIDYDPFWRVPRAWFYTEIGRNRLAQVEGAAADKATWDAWRLGT
jgi:hypothetical protein